MPFDPNKPYEVAGSGKGFDPNKPFAPAPSKSGPTEADLWLGFGIAPSTKPKPVSKPAKPKKPGLIEELGGAAANLNRGLLVVDELQGGLATIESGLRGRIKPRRKPGDAPSPLNPVPLARGIGDAFNVNMAAIRKTEDDFSARRPIVANLSRSAGTGATLLVPGGAVATAPTKLAAAGQGAVAGAAQGIATGLLDRGSLEERTQAAEVNALTGAALGGATGALLARSSKPKPVKLPKAPDLDTMRAQKGAAYRAVDEAGVRYTPEAFERLADDTTAALAEARLSPMRHPKAASMLEDIQGMKGASPTITELDQLRQVIRRDVANSTDDAERFMGGQMIDELDDFIARAGDGDVSEGSAGQAAELIARARDLNTRFRKVESVLDATGRAETRAGSTGSGGNVDNATRQNLRRLMEKGKNFTPDEKAALKDIVIGSPGQNLLRNIGKLSPQGNGLMTALSIGSSGGAGAAFGPLGAVAGAAPGMAGIVSKHIADRMTQQKVQALIDLMAAGGSRAPQAESELLGLAARSPEIAALLNELSSRAPRAAAQGAAELSRPRPVQAQPSGQSTGR